MIGDIFTSLRDTGMLPWAAALLAVVIAGTLMSRSPSTRQTSPESSATSSICARATAERASAPGSMKAVAEDDLDEEGGNSLVDPILGGLSGIASGLPLLGGKDREKVRELLAKAGIRRTDALGLFMTAKIVMAVVGIVLAITIISSLGLFKAAGLLKVAGMLVGAIAGSLFPEFILKQKANGRRNLIVRNLPDALDLMVICTEAGLSLDPTIERVARELRLSAPRACARNGGDVARDADPAEARHGARELHETE